MKLKEGFVLREVAGQNVVIAVGKAGKSFNGMINLNETSTIIWKGVSDGLSDVEIAAKLTEVYDVSSEKALADTRKIISQMKTEGFIEE